MKRFFVIYLGVSALAFSEPTAEDLHRALVEQIDQFESIELKKNGSSEFKLTLGDASAKLNEDLFDGFRFRFPKKLKGKDFIWYFNVSDSWDSWYIFPVDGEPDRAFRSWFFGDKVYVPYDQPKQKKRTRVLQTLEGGYFKPGAEYLMWFRKVGEAAKGELRGRLAFVDAKDSWSHGDVEKALKLKPASVSRQVEALQSRGGMILLDHRFFDERYAKGRIDSAFFSIRQTQRTSGGFFFTIQTSVPSCTTDPSISEIIKEHGAPDFVRTGKEEQRVRLHAGGDEVDEGEQGLTSYHYDHFAFEVSSDDEEKRVLRVTTKGNDFSKIAPEGVESGYRQIDVGNLTVFHKQGKEVGRAYYFLEGSKDPLFIAEPPVGKYENEHYLLEYEGKGKWTWKTRFPSGEDARILKLKDHVLSGEAVGFHENGKKSFLVHYKDGELHGKALQFDETGEEIDRRVFKDGVEVEE